MDSPDHLEAIKDILRKTQYSWTAPMYVYIVYLESDRRWCKGALTVPPLPYGEVRMSTNLNLTLGTLEIATLLSSVLLGIITVQVYIYCTRRFDDTLWLRLLVSNCGWFSAAKRPQSTYRFWLSGIIFSCVLDGRLRHSTEISSALEIAHTIIIWAYLYDLTVIDFSNPRDLHKVPLTLRISPVFIGVTASIVQVRLLSSKLVIPLIWHSACVWLQIYFAYRIRALSGKWALSVTSWVGSLLQLAGNIFIAIVIPKLSIPEFEEHLKWCIIFTLTANVFVDVINTMGMVLFLWRHRDLPSWAILYAETTQVRCSINLYCLQNEVYCR